MTRPIKFRAWDNEDKEMYLPLVLANTDASDPVFRPLRHCKDGNNAYKDHVLMQFTGLLDRNVKEIYEGDLVKILAAHPKNMELIFQIVFDIGAFQLNPILKRMVLWEKLP